MSKTRSAMRRRLGGWEYAGRLGRNLLPCPRVQQRTSASASASARWSPKSTEALPAVLSYVQRYRVARMTGAKVRWGAGLNLEHFNSDLKKN